MAKKLGNWSKRKFYEIITQNQNINVIKNIISIKKYLLKYLINRI